MRYARISLLALASAALLGGCATTGALRKAKEEQQLALDQQRTALATERSERQATDSALRAELGMVRGDLQALRADLQTMRTDFGAKITAMEDGLKFALPVNFAFDVSTVRDGDHAALDRFAKIAQAYYPGSKITIEGFADPAGTAQYNLALSKRRAESVKQYLVAQGLTTNELNIVGYGETRLVTPGASHEQAGAELNRRVTFVIETPSQRSVALAPETEF